jgi:uncharacterized protein YcbK (DUF882 family)
MLTRRRLLGVGGVLAGASAAGFSLARPVAGGEALAKRVALVNLHTNERLEREFYRDATYVPESLAAIQVLLRDYRNDEQHAIDPKLLDYLYDVAMRLEVEPVFSVISGYRSAQTNEVLRERSSGVARHSLHIEGRAIDVRLARVDCATLAAQARAMMQGGVGYYRQSDFVHLDTGAFRTWNGYTVTRLRDGRTGNRPECPND